MDYQVEHIAKTMIGLVNKLDANGREQVLERLTEHHRYLGAAVRVTRRPRRTKIEERRQA